MRRRGIIFKSWKNIDPKKDDVSTALAKLSDNFKLVLEVLCDLRVNTSDDPKAATREGK